MRKLTIRLLSVAMFTMVLSYVLPAGAKPPGTSGFNKQNTIPVACTEAYDGDGDGQNDEVRTAGWIVFTGETLLWPPNHKYRDANVRATDEDNFYGDDNADGAADGNTSPDPSQTDAMDLTLTITDSNTQNGVLNGAGKPTAANVLLPVATDSDAGGSSDGSTDIGFQVQSERAGGDSAGRIYEIKAVANFGDSDDDDSSDDDGRCETTFHICVPHDMRASYRARSDAEKCANPSPGSQVSTT